MGLHRDLALDLGTATVQGAVTGQGVVLREPSLAAADRQTGQVLAVGQAAREMLDRTPGGFAVLRPIQRGVPADSQTVQAMVQTFWKKALGKGLGKPRLLLSVPTGISPVEERALIDAALGRVMASVCIPAAGDKLEEALIQAVHRDHDLVLGRETARAVKHTLDRLPMAVKGRCLTTGLPREIELTPEEINRAFQPVTDEILSALRDLLEQTPPELAQDVKENGILLTGGGSLLPGLAEAIAQAVGIPARVAPEPELCVIQGLEATLPHLNKRKDGPLDLAKRR